MIVGLMLLPRLEVWKDRWIVKLNLEKGTFQEIDHQHDEAWMRPGIPSTFIAQELWVLSDNETIYFQSEVTGISFI
jgi:hypothetical protein